MQLAVSSRPPALLTPKEEPHPADSADKTVTLTVTDINGNMNSCMSLFPNPSSSNELNIRVNVVTTTSMLTIYDLLGRVVWSDQVGEQQAELRINLQESSFGDGIYFIELISRDEKITRRLVIAK